MIQDDKMLMLFTPGLLLTFASFISIVKKKENSCCIFYSQGVMHIKPKLMNLMVSSELYCQACNNMFGDSSLQWQGTSGEDCKIDNYKLSTVSEICIKNFVMQKFFINLKYQMFCFYTLQWKKNTLTSVVQNIFLGHL